MYYYNRGGSYFLNFMTFFNMLYTVQQSGKTRYYPASDDRVKKRGRRVAGEGEQRGKYDVRET